QNWPRPKIPPMK
uniref:Proline-rich peptide 10a-MK n=1 Tax=Bitis nasicornis TaxID=8695 RepID=BPPAA_BITNA